MTRKILVMGVVVGSLLFAGCGKPQSQGQANPTPRARKADVNVNMEPIANRPFVTLTPRADGHAVELNLISEKKPSTDLEYEIEYDSGSLVQGAFGQTSIDAGKFPLSKEILLGSCSTGGKCTFNTDVTGGTLTLRFGNPDYTLKNEWSFAENAKAGNSFVSRDGKFTLDTTKSKLKTGNIIVFQSPGFPGTLTSDLVVGPYAVGANITVGTVSVSIRVPSDVNTAALMGYDGSSWKELSTKISSDRLLTYSGALMQEYLVIKK
jgi:hypothetical protein